MEENMIRIVYNEPDNLVTCGMDSRAVRDYFILFLYLTVYWGLIGPNKPLMGKDYT